MTGTINRLLKIALALMLNLVALAPSFGQPGTTTRVSVSSLGAEGDGWSWDLFVGPAVSANGRFVAFASDSTNLVPGDTNRITDVFIRDCLLGTTERVSVSSSGAQSDNASRRPSMSADGRYVSFYSTADNLVPNDTNGKADVFVRDRLLGTTERVSVSSDGDQANDACDTSASISADGRFVAFWSSATNLVYGDANGQIDVFVRDRKLETTEIASASSFGDQGDGWSGSASISADGRFVTFESDATNLVAGDTDALRDIFVRDRLLETTERVSVSSSGQQADGLSQYPSVSADGRFVTFFSAATNLFAGQSNGVGQILLRDRLLERTELASVATGGGPADGKSQLPSVSADGRFVAFYSLATNLVAGDTNGHADVFVRDRLLAVTDRVSVASSGAQSLGTSEFPSINADGRFVAFQSWSPDLVPGDTNERPDVFVHERNPGRTISGSIAFDSLSQSATAPSQVTVRLKFNGVVFGEGWTVPVGTDGSFTIGVPTGPVELAVKQTHWLRKTVLVDTTSGDTVGITLILVNGDADGNNQVGLGDLSWVLGNWGDNDPMADLDGNGKAGFGDLSIVLSNFNMQGDP